MRLWGVLGSRRRIDYWALDCEPGKPVGITWVCSAGLLDPGMPDHGLRRDDGGQGLDDCDGAGVTMAGAGMTVVIEGPG